MAIIKQHLHEGKKVYRVGNAHLDEKHIIEVARNIVRENSRHNLPDFTAPHQVKSYLIDYCMGLEIEQFGLLLLDSQHRPISTEIIFSGTIAAAPVYPREVVKSVITNNAAAVMLFHNHPSGIPEPSEQDKRVTRRLQDVLNGIDVSLLDHFVVGDTSAVSFAERGLI